MDFDSFDTSRLDNLRPKSWSLLKIFASLLFIILIFGSGVMIGRGDKLNIKWLSKSESTSAFDYPSVDKIYSVLQNDFDGTLDKTKLLDGIKSGLVNAAGDPYTVYFNQANAKNFADELSGSFTGIGAELGSDDSGHIVIVSPLIGYPADKAGLKAKDIIAGIDSQSTSGMSIDSAVTKIRGKAGTNVTLTIVRGSAKAFDVSITRAEITLPSVTSSVADSIGYMRITQFTSDTPDLAEKAAKSFKAQNVKGVILDLRDDPGGYLDSAVSVSSLWLDKGKTVVSERRGSTVLTTDYASGNNILKGLPTVVLINGGSASASEITAGALSDNTVATTVGEKSFGKGSVQEVKCLDSALMTFSSSSNCSGPLLKVTIARWYTPSGKNIDKQGITPDTTVTYSDQDQEAGNDTQKQKAVEILKTKF